MPQQTLIIMRLSRDLRRFFCLGVMSVTSNVTNIAVIVDKPCFEATVL
jgi:hypothetical protein